MNVRVPGQDVDSLEWFFGICLTLVFVLASTFWLIRKSEII